MGLFYGLRYDTGVDHLMYLKQYNAMRETGAFLRHDFEPGFSYISWLFAKAGAHYCIYFAFWGVLQLACIYYALRNHRYLIPWVGLIILLGPYTYGWLSFMRQWTVACVIIALVSTLHKRNFAIYLLIVLLMCTIHKSAIVLLLFYFIPIGGFNKVKRKTLFAILISCTLLGLWPIWLNILGFISDIVEWLGYGKYDYLLNPLLHGQTVFKYWGPLHIIAFFAELVVIYYFTEIREHTNHDQFFVACFGIAFIGICYENLFMNTMFFMLRPCEYFYIFMVVLLAYTFHYLYETGKRWLLLVIAIVICSYIYCLIFKNVAYLPTPRSKILYHFFCESQNLML